MSFDGSGTFNLLYTWSTEGASPPIAISKLDGEMAGVATALSTCLLRNGTGKPTADIDWNAKKLTNLADATAATDALNRQTADARYAAAANYAIAEAGSFTAYLRATPGGADLASGIAYWRKVNNVVTLRLPAMSTNSAATTLWVESLPAEIRVGDLSGGTTDQPVPVWGYDNASSQLLVAHIFENASSISIRKNPDADFTGGATLKGLVGRNTITYQISD